MEQIFANVTKIPSLWRISQTMRGAHPVCGAKENRPEGRLKLLWERDQIDPRRVLTGIGRPGARPTFAACDP